jgi:hypothetical protein
MLYAVTVFFYRRNRISVSSATGGLEVLKDHNFGIVIVIGLKVLRRLPSNGSIPDGVIGIFQ